MFLFLVELSYGNALTPGTKPVPPWKSAHGFEKVAVAPRRIVVSLPKGGAMLVLKWNWPSMKAYEMPYDARMAVLPSPFGSYAKPKRGPNVFQFLSIPARPFGNDGSPGNVKPEGPFTN